MANGILKIWIICVIWVSQCIARPKNDPPSSSGDNQVLENSGINPIHVMNHNVISIQKYKKLYSRNSAMYVRIHGNQIDGSKDLHDKNVNILLESTGFFSQVRIKSNSGTEYLCLSSSGDVVLRSVTQGKSDNGCIFYEDMSSKGYTTFRSKLRNTWYLAITRSGRPKSARKTHAGQRAVHFIKYN